MKKTFANYKQDELLSATHIVRHFKSILDNLVSKKKSKVGVLRKNKLEAVILPIKEYEEFIKYKAFVEEYAFYKEVQDRVNDKNQKMIPFEEVLKENGITL